jgi:hypothetical protein
VREEPASRTDARSSRPFPRASDRVVSATGPTRTWSRSPRATFQPRTDARLPIRARPMRGRLDYGSAPRCPLCVPNRGTGGSPGCPFRTRSGRLTRGSDCPWSSDPAVLTTLLQCRRKEKQAFRMGDCREAARGRVAGGGRQILEVSDRPHVTLSEKPALATSISRTNTGSGLRATARPLTGPTRRRLNVTSRLRFGAQHGQATFWRWNGHWSLWQMTDAHYPGLPRTTRGEHGLCSWQARRSRVRVNGPPTPLGCR